MIHISEAIITEGKYDKIKLESFVDTLIIATDGFNIFKNKKKLDMIRRIAESRGIIIMTDSDAAGFKIRSYLVGSIPDGKIKHAYIPDILGKEKRKDKRSKEGKLGVEGVSSAIIVKALKMAGATSRAKDVAERQIINYDFYEAGLCGHKDSKRKRGILYESLGLPERLSTSAAIKVLNSIMTYDEFRSRLEELARRYEFMTAGD